MAHFLAALSPRLPSISSSITSRGVQPSCATRHGEGPRFAQRRGNPESTAPAAEGPCTQRGAHLVYGLLVGAALKQQPHNLQMAVASGKMQRRPVILRAIAHSSALRSPQRCANVERTKPAAAGPCSGARTFSLASLSAPLSSSSRATPRCPFSAAKCNGVQSSCAPSHTAQRCGLLSAMRT